MFVWKLRCQPWPGEAFCRFTWYTWCAIPFRQSLMLLSPINGLLRCNVSEAASEHHLELSICPKHSHTDSRHATLYPSVTLASGTALVINSFLNAVQSANYHLVKPDKALAHAI